MPRAYTSINQSIPSSGPWRYGRPASSSWPDMERIFIFNTNLELMETDLISLAQEHAMLWIRIRIGSTHVNIG